MRAGLTAVTWSIDAFNYLAANPEMAILDQLGAVDLPAVVIAAEGDFICSPPLGERIHQALDGSVFVEIAESGHFPWVEQPDSFWEALDGALTRITTA
jgi:pimeloyl-ACP methyl ester carboxylesterase